MIKTFSFLLGICLLGSSLQASVIDWNCGWGYAGLHAGYVSSKARTNLRIPPATFQGGEVRRAGWERLGNQHIFADGFVGGGQFGYNLPFCARYLAGLEVNLGAFLLDRSKTFTAFNIVGTEPEQVTSLNEKFQTNALLTLCPRFGVNLCRSLIYVTGGLALTDLRHKTLFSDNLADVQLPPSELTLIGTSKTRVVPGWAVGAGLEQWFGCRLSLFVSYLYTDFRHVRSQGYIVSSNGNAVFSNAFLDHGIKLRAHIARFGFNVKI